jgi:kynurenine formamidase
MLTAAGCAPVPSGEPTGQAPDQAGAEVAASAAGTLAGRLVDLTHPFDADTIYWPTDTQGFALETVSKGMTDQGYFYEANRFSTAEHGGTHLDAPVHFAENGWTADEIPVDKLVGPAAVVDVTAAAAADPDYLVSVADLEGWEAANGRLPDGAIVLLRTGWGGVWPDRQRYLGTARRGPEAIPELHFPGLDPEAARWLVEQRSIDAVGLDTPSIDYGQSKDFQSHRTLFAANVPAFENVAHLDQLPEAGATVLALPMKIAGGSGGPLRIIAVVPEG